MTKWQPSAAQWRLSMAELQGKIDSLLFLFFFFGFLFGLFVGSIR
jgi:hypothetical protein